MTALWSLERTAYWSPFAVFYEKNSLHEIKGENAGILKVVFILTTQIEKAG
jgi:hypothetical protein